MRRNNDKRIFVKCSYCGEDVLKKLSEIKDHNFCNRNHFNLWMRTPPENILVTQDNIDTYLVFKEFKDIRATVNFTQRDLTFVKDSITKVYSGIMPNIRK